jgi:hypothetical protein
VDHKTGDFGGVDAFVRNRSIDADDKIADLKPNVF